MIQRAETGFFGFARPTNLPRSFIDRGRGSEDVKPDRCALALVAAGAGYHPLDLGNQQDFGSLFGMQA